MDEVQQLSLAKQFIDEAERHLPRRDDYGHGQAVSLTQDAVELIVRAAIRHLGLSGNPKATLMDMIGMLDEHEVANGRAKTPHRKRIDDINVARISFKHRGISLGESDAWRLVRFGVDFAEEAVPKFFGLEWRSLSLADAIRDPDIKALVKQAEAHLAKEEFQDALVEAADAVKSVERALERFFPSTEWRGEFDSNRRVADYMNGLRQISLAALVQTDARSLSRFRTLGVHVSTSVSGKRSVTLTKGSPPTQEEACFGVEFARDFALAVQARLG